MCARGAGGATRFFVAREPLFIPAIGNRQKTGRGGQRAPLFGLLGNVEADLSPARDLAACLGLARSHEVRLSKLTRPRFIAVIGAVASLQ